GRARLRGDRLDLWGRAVPLFAELGVRRRAGGGLRVRPGGGGPGGATAQLAPRRARARGGGALRAHDTSRRGSPRIVSVRDRRPPPADRRASPIPWPRAPPVKLGFWRGFRERRSGTYVGT